MDWGAIIAGAAGGGAAAVNSLADNAIEDQRKSKMLALHADLELQKAQAAAKFAADLKRAGEGQERARVAGIVQSATDKFTAPGAVGSRNGMDVASDQAQGAAAPTPRYSDISREAANQGDVATAQHFDKMQDSGNKSIPYGGVLTDSDGKVIYDNSVGRQQSDMLRAQGAANRGQPKAVDEAQLQQMTQRAQATVSQAYKGMVDPFASPLATGADRQDQATPRVMGNVIGRMIESAASQGQILPPAAALHRLQPFMRQANAQVIAAANKRAAAVFDKNKVRPEMVEALQQLGAPDDPQAFKQWYRENNLESVFNSLVEAERTGGGKKPGAAPAPAPAPASGAPAGPVAAPAMQADAPAPDSYDPAQAPTERDVADQGNGGTRLDAAREALAQLRQRAPGLKQGNAAREAYAKELAAAQEAVRAAERDYQANSGVISAAFGGRR